jgi:hypothetical protein
MMIGRRMAARRRRNVTIMRAFLEMHGLTVTDPFPRS